MNNCLFTCCTKNYLIYAEYLYKSFSKTNNNIIFEIILINCCKDNYFEKQNNKNIIISYDKVKYKDENLRCYSSYLRAKFFPKLLKKYKKVFWMDADTIIRKDISELYNKLDINDLIIYKNDINNKKINIKKHGLYKTGIIGMNNKLLNFSIKWSKMIFDNLNFFWYQDQQTISKLILEENISNIYLLEKKYIDWDFDITSPIWVGKGVRKYSDMYLLEFKNYD